MKKELKNLKKAYLSLEPPRELLEHGWGALEKELEENDAFSFVPRFLSIPLVFVILFFLLAGGGLVYASQHSLPGEPLYPIKRLSEKAFIAVSADKTSQVDKRAQEVVIATEKKNNDQETREAVKEYEKSIKEVKHDLEAKEIGRKEKTEEKKSEKKDLEKKNFEKKLEKHEKEFERLIEKKPDVKEELHDAIEATKRGRDNVPLDDILHSR